MTYRLVCKLLDKITTIIPINSEGTFKNCHPSRKVPILHIQGKVDLCGLYNGRMYNECMVNF